MACLNESAMQGYLEELAPAPLSQRVESHLSSCARCRTTFDRVVTTNRRVNGWLSKLTPPPNTAIDAGRAARRIAEATQPIIGKQLFAQHTDPRALASSFILQGAIVACLLFLGTSQFTRKAETQLTLIAPPPAPQPAHHTASHQGGGGQHSPLLPLKGQLPKPESRVFITPLPTNQHPALVMDASLIAPPDAWTAPTGQIGNPLGVFDGAGGPGTKGGLGDSDGTGIGGKRGDGTGGDSSIFAVGNGISRPEVITRADPEYSEEARKAKYSGSVILSIVVNTDGRAADIKVVKSLGMGLDEKAIEAVRKWLFRPGMNKGVPVRVKAQVEVNFRLL